jgi:F-type H+/Na+-transporting ATPase subunit alpha
VLKQAQGRPRSVAEQLAVLVALTAGLFDDVELEDVVAAAGAVGASLPTELDELFRRLEHGQPLEEDDRRAIVAAAGRAIGAAVVARPHLADDAGR